MLPSMQDEVQELDPREELLEKARDKFQAGDFKSVRAWLEETIDEATEETAVLKPIRANLKLDPGAVMVASVSGLAILIIALLTLFH